MEIWCFLEHSISPIPAKVHDKALKLHAIAQLKVIMNGDNHNNPQQQNQNTSMDSDEPQSTTSRQTVATVTNGVVPSLPQQQLYSPSSPRRNPSQQTTVTTVGSMQDYPLPETYPGSPVPDAVANGSTSVTMVNMGRSDERPESSCDIVQVG